MAGGMPGQRGLNFLILQEGEDDAKLNRTVSLGGKNTVEVAPGTRLQIETPGGGGYGAVEASAEEKKDTEKAPSLLRLGGGSLAEYTAAQETA